MHLPEMFKIRASETAFPASWHHLLTINLMVKKYMFLREFWTDIRSSNNELNLFGNLLASDKNIGLANC
jgi:hypothetical protein